MPIDNDDATLFGFIDLDSFQEILHVYVGIWKGIPAKDPYIRLGKHLLGLMPDLLEK
jgi:hypothetical protein